MISLQLLHFAQVRQVEGRFSHRIKIIITPDTLHSLLQSSCRFLRISLVYTVSIAMEKQELTHNVDSDSGRSPSEDEKRIRDIPVDQALQEIPDPDAHLSAEEKAKIV